jgi:hypothetical protein
LIAALDWFAGCFTDKRDGRNVEHRIETLIGQRIFGSVLGYEDLNAITTSCARNPTFGVLAGKLQPVLRSDCEALAGKSTLNRLEHTPRRHAAKYLAAARERCRQRRRSRRDRAHVRRSASAGRTGFILRADSGFTNDELMGCCGANRVDYVFGLAGNCRLEAAPVDQFAEAKLSVPPWASLRACSATSSIARSTAGGAPRRVVGKAEHTLEDANPRFVVSSLKRSRTAGDACAPYEHLYCAREGAENHLEEQFELFADRDLSATMQTMANVLVDTLRRVSLRHSQFADAAVATIRLKLLRARCAPAYDASTSLSSPCPIPDRVHPRHPLAFEQFRLGFRDADYGHKHVGAIA